VCGDIGARTREVAAALRGIPGLDVEVSDGAGGEFAMLVDGQQVSGKKGEELPSADEVTAAVKDVALARQSV